MIRSGVKWLAVSLLGVLALATILWCASRLWPMPEQLRHGLALMQAPDPAEGPSGYALLWMLEFDGMDDASREAAMVVDAARWRAHPEPAGGMRKSAEDDHPRISYPAGRSCSGPTGTCLAEVRREPQRFAQAHAGHQGVHARVAQLAGFEQFTHPWDTDVAAIMLPMPAFNGLTDPIAAHALAHVRGDTAGALQGLCAGIVAGRRLLSGGDTLIASTLGMAMVELNGGVLGEVLAELPRDAALPAACQAALQPMDAAQTSLCRPMRGELQFGGMALRYSARAPGAVLALDVARSQARIASGYSWACDPAQQQALVEDRQIAPPPLPTRGFDCVANLVGCTMSDIPPQLYLPYAERSQDAAAMVRLLAAQQWLRTQPGTTVEALARLPAAFHSATRAPQASADGHWLQVPRHATSRGDDERLLRVPLRLEPAPSRQAAR
ncbi:MAG: hypothetical protein JHC82_14455 [Stenotrophomonas sp.]|nr:hypothetical protein [Stenotrophomonas sp.]